MTNNANRTQDRQAVMSAIDGLPWQQLVAHAKRPLNLSKLFAQNNVSANTPVTALQSDRAKVYSASLADLYMDYSKQLVDNDIMSALLALADSCNLRQRICDLLSGKKVNSSENRPALHTALRLPKQPNADLVSDGIIDGITDDVHDSLDKVADMANRIRSGMWRGYSGKAVTDVVNLGVGGSDLGPLMVTTALQEWADTDIRVHFVSNMDGSQLESLLKHLNPETSLFIISSKSFATVDTLSNAKSALAWLCQFTTEAAALRRHFIGISANLSKVSAWGIHPDNQLKFWDWVGGRFSLWSAIGLAIAVRVGMEQFRALLAGANAMDEHFAKAPFRQNLPVLMGLLAVWNATFLRINAHTVLPYDGRLTYFPSYLTQLEMESNGKSVSIDGNPVSFATCPILWGEIGSNAQHAFYQLLHQGTQRVSCDFIACVNRYDDTVTDNVKHHDGHGDDNMKHANRVNLKEQHQLSLANCLAQSRVLAFGNAANNSSVIQDDGVTQDDGVIQDEVQKFRHYHGNQPSTTLLIDRLTPHNLGMLIALYEHKVYVMASIWHINPFDQWGVEMGKKVADDVYQQLITNKHNQVADGVFDASTQQLLSHIKQQQSQTIK